MADGRGFEVGSDCWLDLIMLVKVCPVYDRRWLDLLREAQPQRTLKHDICDPSLAGYLR